MKNNSTLEDLASDYKVSGLEILTSKHCKLQRGEAIKIYYTYLVSGIYYYDALRKAGKGGEADRLMREILKNLDKSPINVDKLFKKTHFLKDNTDFGKMEHGVVE